MTVVFWSTPEPMWLFLTPQHDGFLCNSIWGLKGQARSTEVSCLALHVLWFLWIPWIFSQYYVWYLGKDLKSLQFCIAKCDFWFVWHFSREIWHKVMSHDPALLAKTEILLLYPNMIPWTITNSPAYTGHVHTAAAYGCQSCIWVLKTVMFTHSLVIMGRENRIL